MTPTPSGLLFCFILSVVIAVVYSLICHTLMILKFIYQAWTSSLRVSFNTPCFIEVCTCTKIRFANLKCATQNIDTQILFLPPVLLILGIETSVLQLQDKALSVPLIRPFPLALHSYYQ